MTEPLVLRADRDGVTTLTLNRPHKLNALTPGVFAELQAHVEDLRDDESVRCVVLAGAGRSFCAGHDMGTIDEDPGATDHPESETIEAFEALPMPTVARLHGHCFTGGLELALACDLLVAAASTELGDTHGQWGLAPVWGMSVRLPERVGIPTAKRLMFTSMRIDGAQAAALRLVDLCVPDDQLDAELDALTAAIAANSAGTNRIDKAMLAATAGRSRAQALAYERSEPFGRPADMAERMANALR